MQYLTMPFAVQMMLTGYKSPGYRAHWGYEHYGVDVSGHYAKAAREILASGDGTVALAGRDSKVGNVVVVVYSDVYLRATDETRPLVARYLHLASLDVKAGQAVRAGDRLGLEGNTGTTDLHLHLELDTDIQYPAHSPQVAGGTLIKKGVDTTLNPSRVLYLGVGQRLVEPTYNPAWLGPDDRAIPAIPITQPTPQPDPRPDPDELAELRRKAAVYDTIKALVK